MGVVGAGLIAQVMHLHYLRELSDRYEVVALLPVGHPKGRWGVAPRRPASALTNWNRFGERRR